MLKEARAAGLSIERHLGASLQVGPFAKLHRSRRRFYKFKAPFHRPIAHGKGAVLIHRSVKQRWDADPKYRPPNLSAYVAGEQGWGTL